MPHKRTPPNWLRFLLGSLFLVLICGIVLGADIFNYSFVTEAAPADAAIVLGTEAWNTQPSPVFRERINHGIDLYKEGRVRYLIFTGGAGKNEPVAEAIVARDYAIQNGVVTTDILYETRSTVTFENLCYSRDIVRVQNLGRVLIVSDPMHMRRSMTIARDLGIDAYPSPTPHHALYELSEQVGVPCGRNEGVWWVFDTKGVHKSRAALRARRDVGSMHA